MSRLERSHLRIVRDPEPLGSYIRPISRDINVLSELLASGQPIGSGIIVDARPPEKSDDLRQTAKSRGVELVLDPNSVELSTDGGIDRSGMLQLPWSGGECDTPDSLGRRAEAVVESIAATAVTMSVDAVLAPAHFLESLPSRWLDLDIQLAEALRRALDEDPRGRKIRIYYPLVSNLGVLSRGPILARIRDELQRLRQDEVIDAIWLRMHAFGSTSSGRLNLRRYADVSRRLHPVGVPIIGERTGTVGLALMSLGCIAGIESGVTHGERCDIRALQREPRPGQGGFAPAPRVYLPAIGAFLNREPARQFFSAPGIKNWFACQRPCCRRGFLDMLADPRRHFLITRASEVRELAAVPAEVRPEHYLTTWLRPASDRVIRASRVLPELAKQRRRLDDWRETLSDVRSLDAKSRPTVSPPISLFDGPTPGKAGSAGR